jgi:hypothetical protein
MKLLKAEPGKKTKFDPDVWTRIDPAGMVVVVVDIVGLVVVDVVVVDVVVVDAVALTKGGALAEVGRGEAVVVVVIGRGLPAGWGTPVTGRGVAVIGRDVTRSARMGTLLTGCTTDGLTIGARNITGGRPGTWETAANTNVPIKARVPNRLAITRMTHLSCRTCVLA